MKIIQEYSIKVIIMILFLMIFSEACFLSYIDFNANEIFKKTYNETLKKTEQKTIEITRNTKNFTAGLLMKYITKLKLIARHILLYKGMNNTNNTMNINYNSKIFANNNNKKRIIQADLNYLIYTMDFFKIYKDTGQLLENGFPKDISTINLNYTNYYKQIFENVKDNSILINILLNKQNELNYIGYHYFGKNKSYDITKDEEKNNLVKYILVILKSMYISRLSAKKQDLEIIRFLILNDEEIFIYPPEDYRKINLIQFRTVNPLSKCQYTANDLSDYPSCIYDYIINDLFPSNTNYVLIIKEAIIYHKILTGFCIQFHMKKGSNKKSVLCIEIDFSTFANSIKISNTINFEFGLFHPINITLPMVSLADIFIVLDNRIKVYYELFYTYNNKETTPSQFFLNISDTSKLLNYFSLYHFMYFNTTKILNEHPELKQNISKFVEEYTYVVKQIFFIEYQYKYINKQEFYSFTFNRTICRKKPLNNEYECVIDENEMRIMPLIININELNEEFIETAEIGSDYYDLFIFSITSTNPKINADNINSILSIKLLRITFFYIMLSFIIFCFFILFIKMISEYSFDFIKELINEINSIEIDDDKKEINYIKENKNFLPNDEMIKLNKVYELIRKSLIIKHSFNKELFLHRHHLEFYTLIQDIKRKNIKEICNSFISSFHFSNNIFNLSENEIYSTIEFIQENEKRIKSNESNENDNKLKDTIKRSSIATYLNEYSTFDNIDENMLDIIYLKIFKQRFIYLYAMNKYKLANEISTGNNNIIQHNAG